MAIEISKGLNRIWAVKLTAPYAGPTLAEPGPNYLRSPTVLPVSFGGTWGAPGTIVIGNADAGTPATLNDGVVGAVAAGVERNNQTLTCYIHLSQPKTLSRLGIAYTGTQNSTTLTEVFQHNDDQGFTVRAQDTGGNQTSNGQIFLRPSGALFTTFSTPATRYRVQFSSNTWFYVYELQMFA